MCRLRCGNSLRSVIIDSLGHIDHTTTPLDAFKWLFYVRDWLTRFLKLCERYPAIKVLTIIKIQRSPIAMKFNPFLLGMVCNIKIGCQPCHTPIFELDSSG